MTHPYSYRPAVVLLSGGLDSATALAVAVRDQFKPNALTFSYGQRHGQEVRAAARTAAHFNARHLVVDLPPSVFGGSALTDPTVPVPHDQAAGPGIPITYVPARNTVFLALALAWAETLGAADIFIGVNATDYSGYPDCRPEFVEAFEQAANLGTRAGVSGTKIRIHAPLIGLSKAETIALGLRLGVDYALTHSCYDPVGESPCGTCDACVIRRRGFDQLGYPDPATVE